MVAGAGATSIAISASERAELLRDPEKFAARAEAVLNSVVAKLNRLKAEQAAERIDSEQQYHKLERSQATLRAEHERAVAQHDKMAAEHASIVQARDTATGEVARLNRELREKSAEIVRAQEQVHESGNERRRMVEVNERMSRQLEAAESDVTAAREALAQARSSSAAHERRAVEKEAEAMAAKMQASTQLGQLELANQRTEQAEQFVKQLTAELTAVRERKAEAQVTSSAMHAEVAAERAMLASQLKQAQQLAAGLQSQLDTLTAQHTTERSESAAHAYTLQRNLEETERRSFRAGARALGLVGRTRRRRTRGVRRTVGLGLLPIAPFPPSVRGGFAPPVALSPLLSLSHLLFLSLSSLTFIYALFSPVVRGAQETSRLLELQQRLHSSMESLAASRASAVEAAAKAAELEADLSAAQRAADEARAAAASSAGGALVVAPVSDGAMEEAAAAHRLLGESLPGGEAPASATDSRAQLYAKCAEMERRLRQAISDRDEHAESLRAIHAELQAKAPRIVELRADHAKLLEKNQVIASDGR